MNNKVKNYVEESLISDEITYDDLKHAFELYKSQFTDKYMIDFDKKATLLFNSLKTGNLIKLNLEEEVLKINSDLKNRKLIQNGDKDKNSVQIFYPKISLKELEKINSDYKNVSKIIFINKKYNDFKKLKNNIKYLNFVDCLSVYKKFNLDMVDDEGRLVKYPKLKEVFSYKNEDKRIIIENFKVSNKLYDINRLYSLGELSKEIKDSLSEQVALKYLESQRIVNIISEYVKLNPEKADKEGRLVIFPKIDETFSFTDKVTEEHFEDFPIGLFVEKVRKGGVKFICKSILEKAIKLDHSESYRFVLGLKILKEERPDLLDDFGKFKLDPPLKTKVDLKENGIVVRENYQLGKELSKYKKGEIACSDEEIKQIKDMGIKMHRSGYETLLKRRQKQQKKEAIDYIESKIKDNGKKDSKKSETYGE